MHSALLPHFEFWLYGETAPLPERKRKDGYIYLATSDVLNATKIGCSKGTIQALQNRYVTCYGPSVILYTAEVADCFQKEHVMHTAFSHLNVGNELFKKAGLAQYLKAMQKMSSGLSVWCTAD